jgi:hypothetical protein
MGKNVYMKKGCVAMVKDSLEGIMFFVTKKSMTTSFK